VGPDYRKNDEYQDRKEHLEEHSSPAAPPEKAVLSQHRLEVPQRYVGAGNPLVDSKPVLKLISLLQLLDLLEDRL